MAVPQPVSTALPSFVFFTLILVLTPMVACRATPEMVPRSDAVATAPSAARRPVSKARAAAAESVATELMGATNVVAAAASTATEGTDPGPSAEAQVIVSPEGAPREDAPRTTPVGGATGAGSSPLARRELPSIGELLDQPVQMGWDIVVSGSALAASHPESSLLARAHHAIDKLGGSLVAGLADGL